MLRNFLDISGSALSDNVEKNLNLFKFVPGFIIASFVLIFIIIIVIFIKHAKNVDKIKKLKNQLEDKQPQEIVEGKNLCEYCGAVVNENENQCLSCGARKVKK